MTQLNVIRDIVAAVLSLAATMWYLFTPQPSWGILRLEAVVAVIIITIGTSHGESNLLLLWQAASRPVLDRLHRRRQSM
jgi:hypothetical protein